MAAAHVASLARDKITTGATSHTFSVTTNQATLGNKLIMVAIGTAAPNSASDSKGNTWTRDKLSANGTVQVAIFSCVPTSALTTSDTITITMASSSQLGYSVEEFSGLQNVAPDTSAAANTASGALVSMSVTTTTDDLLFAAWDFFQTADPAFSPTSGWTGVEAASAVNTRWLMFEYVEQTSAGAYSTSGASVTGTNTNAGALVAYKVTAGTTFTDSGSGTITLSGSLVESHTVADTVSGTITLGGSRTEAHTVSDSATGTITLGGSIIESKRYTDAPSGTIQLGGSSTEHFTGPTIYTDAVSGTIKLLGFTSTFQWQQDEDGDGNFVDIPGAVEQFLVVANELEPRLYLGNAVRVLVTATSNFGTVTVASEPTVPIFNSMTAAPTTSAQPSAPTRTMTPAEATAQTMTPAEPTLGTMSPTDPA